MDVDLATRHPIEPASVEGDFRPPGRALRPAVSPESVSRKVYLALTWEYRVTSRERRDDGRGEAICRESVVPEELETNAGVCEMRRSELSCRTE